MCTLIAVMAWSYIDAVAVRCVLPVLWMMSCYHPVSRHLFPKRQERIQQPKLLHRRLKLIDRLRVTR